jgi:hypothetical protein
MTTSKCFILTKLAGEVEGSSDYSYAVKVFLSPPERKDLESLPIPDKHRERIIDSLLEGKEGYWGDEWDYEGYGIEEVELAK